MQSAELGLAQQGKSENMARVIITTLNYNCAHLEFEKLGHYRSNFTMKWINFLLYTMVRTTFWIIIEPLLHVLYVGLEISYSSKNRVLLKSWCSRFEIFDVFEKLKNPKKNCIVLYVFSDSFYTDWLIFLSIHKKIVGLVCGQFWCHRPTT